MSSEKVIKLLLEKIEKLKNKRHRVIIFWLDTDKSYGEMLNTLNIPDFKIVRQEYNNQFLLKKTIEIDNPNQNYIIYRDEEIKINDNWLFDIEKYSEYFAPDEISALLDELEVEKRFYGVFQRHKKLFAAGKRKDQFKQFYNKNYTQKELYLSMLAVALKSKGWTLYDVVKSAVINAFAGEDVIKELAKYQLEEVFINLIKTEYEFDLEKNSINDFVFSMLYCHLDYKIKKNAFSETFGMNKNNSYLTMEYLLKDSLLKGVVNPLLQRMEKDERVIDLIETVTLSDLVKLDTLDIFDVEIIKLLLHEIKNNGVDYSELMRIIVRRKTETYSFKTHESEYSLIELGIQFRETIENINFNNTNALSALRAYVENYYKVDTIYRKFYQLFEKLEDKEKFENLRDIIERDYTTIYNRYLSEHWEDVIEESNIFNSNMVTQQTKFYEKEIMPFIKKKNKIFVIISDALRYEAGFELAEIISREATNKAKVETDFMLTSMPSITKIGMSALLPQKNVEFNNGDISIDGISTNGTANRDKILKTSFPDSMAISSKDIINLNKQEMQEKFKGLSVVYIYHDTIDAIGDNAKTEDKVFEAVTMAQEEIKNIVFALNSRAKATNIYITSDHGFLYQREALKEYNKLSQLSLDTYDKGKRYFISSMDIENETMLKLNMDSMFKGSNLKAYIPLRNTRFKMAGGGSKFVHGGVSLQETVIPLIKFKYLKNDVENKQKVRVDLLNTNRTISNNLIKLSFMQSDKVDPINKIFGRKISIALYDENELISDEKVLLLDSIEDKIIAREFNIELNIKNMRYDLYKKYKLKLIDLEDGEEIAIYDFDVRFNNF